jgi:hypothetical protein
MLYAIFRKKGNVCKGVTRAYHCFSLLFLFVSLFCVPFASMAQVMQSSNYQIERDSLNFGGGLGSSASYVLEDTLGEIGTGRFTSASYILKAGYQQFDETTTPTPTPTPTPEPTPPPGGGGIPPAEHPLPEIFNITIAPGTHGASLTFETDPHTIADIKWGITEEYDSGIISTPIYLTQHSAIFSPLTSGTLYFFSITATDGFGGEATYKGYFTTLSEVIVEEPSVFNVKNFKATPTEENIILLWENPVHPRFAGVKIVRSDEFYPIDINDGELVYSGAEEGAVDVSAEKGVVYYYTLFVEDTDGELSSGAIAQARIPLLGEILEEISYPFKDIPQVLEVHPQLKDISFLDFIVIQHGKILYPDPLTRRIKLDAGAPFTVSIDYDKLPEILKTIGVTLTDPEDKNKTFSFLLRVNDEKTAYRATIAPLERAGSYDVSIVILDYANQGLKKLGGELVASVAASSPVFPSFTLLLFGDTSSLLLTLLLLILLFALTCRRTEEETERLSVQSRAGYSSEYKKPLKNL